MCIILVRYYVIFEEASVRMNMTYGEILPGIKLRVLETDRFKTSCLSVQFLARISDDTASKRTLIPRVLRRGTLKHPDMESLAAALDDMYGAQIEPVSRKYGDIITSGFVCDFVEAGDKILPDIRKLLSEVVFEPKLEEGAFRADYVDGERANLIDEIKSEINNKLHYAHRRATERMFRGTPYAVSELGTEEAAEAVTSESLYRHYKKMLAESPCEIFFCGAYSYAEVECEVKKMFRLCTRSAIKSISSNPPVYTECGHVTECLDIAQANLLVGMHSEDEDVYVSKLLTTVIGGGTSSKLFVNVREKSSLCYFAGATFDTFKKTMFMYCGIDPKNAEKAEREVLLQYQSCVMGDITDEEISNAKKGMMDDLVTVEDSPFSLEAFWLRAALLRDERTPLEIAALIKSIDSTRLKSAAESFSRSIVYLLTGMEVKRNETKLLSDA